MKKSNKRNLILFVILIICLIFMSIGFATYNQTVNLNGTVILKGNGEIYIKEVVLESASHADANPVINDNGSIDFNLNFTTVADEDAVYNATFKVVVANDSLFDYVYTIPNYKPSIIIGDKDYSDYVDYKVSGITAGQTIPSKSEATFEITFTFTKPDDSTGTYDVDGDFSPDFSEKNVERLIGSVDDSTEGDLTGSNEYAEFTVDVINTYSEAKTFTIVADSEKFKAVALSKTGDPQYTIDANNSGTSFKFYLTKVDGSEYVSGKERVRILIVPTGMSSINTGNVTVLVDKTIDDYKDTTPPTIKNVVAKMDDTEGNATVTWEGSDDSGTVEQYTIIAYSNGSVVQTQTISDDSGTYTFTNLAEGDYYFVVYGQDASKNKPTQTEIDNATTSEGSACKSNNVTLKWNFTVTNNSDTQTIRFTGNTTAKRGETYTATLTVTDALNYNQLTKSDIEVTMGGKTVDFTFVTNSGTLTIQNVTGDIVIKATAQEGGGCLVEGTKILLSDGTYKNIEDIKYTDLLKVYDHVNGKMTNVYPIWIERKSTGYKYRKITFSDGNYLKTVNNHSIFDVDKKRYINVANDNECKKGTNVYKVKNGNLEVVSIINIEDVYEKINYYNVVSTSYYNVIANDILTTDTTSSISNIYGFKDNAIYGDNFYRISNGNNKLEYNYIASLVPHYLYKGLNLQNAKELLNGNLDMNFLSAFVSNKTIEPITKDGKMYFIVSTSLDKIDSSNVDNYLYVEGEYYTLPSDMSIKYFVDTSTNKKYLPGEKVLVENSIHFIAKAVYTT